MLKMCDIFWKYFFRNKTFFGKTHFVHAKPIASASPPVKKPAPTSTVTSGAYQQSQDFCGFTDSAEPVHAIQRAVPAPRGPDTAQKVTCPCATLLTNGDQANAFQQYVFGEQQIRAMEMKRSAAKDDQILKINELLMQKFMSQNK